MANLLANPLDELKGSKGEAPAWIWKVAASGAGILGGLLGPQAPRPRAQQGQHARATSR